VKTDKMVDVMTFALILQLHKSRPFFAFQCSFVATNDDASGKNTTPHYLDSLNSPMDRIYSTEHRLMIVEKQCSFVKID